MEAHSRARRSSYRRTRMRSYRTRRARKLYQYRGCSVRGALDAYRAAVILHDLADDGQSKARAVGLAGTYKWVEHVGADAFRNSATLIDHPHFEGIFAAFDIDDDSALHVQSGFARVQH